MKFSIPLPWRRPVERLGVREEKAHAGGVLVLSSEAGRAHWSGRSYAALSREGFMKNPVAHRAARMVAEAAASISWLLYEGEEEIGEHALLRLLHRPNAQMSGPDFFEALYGHLLLSGNGFIEPVLVGGRLRELHLLRPDRVTLVEGADGWPAAFDYRAEGRAARRIAADRDGLGLLHLKLFNPLDDHNGLSPLASAGAALDLHNAASHWNKRLLDNSARPSGALVYQPKEGGNLSIEQYERLKRELEEGYAGAVNAGRPLLLEGGLDWKSMGLSPRDMDFMEAKNGAARDIALSLGVPPMLLGIPGDNTYANYQEANRAFYRLTVLPLINRTAASLSVWLAPLFAGDVRLEADLDKIAGLSSERDALWTRVGAAAFLSDEEKREAVGY
ncbi:phage portal protein [Agrobacterium larrymoorei]|uniref:Phage portal protein n=1 Tax=Agrobacterium larrymoorei TaxID=160699 RepID=A0A4D7DVQ9_9HYPH|nr:phage portal protein [Agrobacterium larrymoorei]QCI98346.1 phage portal protein [Agrobacterium larrymoorei]QYA06200.1 phage portal protein [Agrobacterium larrymoorei]